MDDTNHNKLVNQLLQNAPNSARLNRMPIIPIPSTTVHSPAQVNTTTNVSRPITSVGTRADVLRIPKRVQHQQYVNQYNMSSPSGTSINSIASFGGAYNNYSYNRPYMNSLSMGSNYNQYNSYGQPLITPRYQSPTINAAAESSRPAFDSIWSIVESFNAVSMMLETTLAAMQTSFQALLTVAENFTRLKAFLTRLYSTVVSLNLLKWFLTKLFHLLKMVRGGGRGTSTEENIWTALSDTNQVSPNDRLSWPIVVFTGLLVATPYFVYKLINSVIPSPESPLALSNKENRPVEVVLLKSLEDWSNPNPKSISVVKGATYMSSKARLDDSVKNGGWLLVEDGNGKSGFVPLQLLKIIRIFGETHNESPPVTPDIFNVTSNVVPVVSERVLSPSMSPIIDVDDNPIELPHPLLVSDKLKNDIE